MWQHISVVQLDHLQEHVDRNITTAAVPPHCSIDNTYNGPDFNTSVTVRLVNNSIDAHSYM